MQRQARHERPRLTPLQAALSAKIPGARIDVRQLETGKPVGIPVSIRVSGEDIADAARLAEERARRSSARCPIARARARRLGRGELRGAARGPTPIARTWRGVTNLDVAAASASA